MRRRAWVWWTLAVFVAIAFGLAASQHDEPSTIDPRTCSWRSGRIDAVAARSTVQCFEITPGSAVAGVQAVLRNDQVIDARSDTSSGRLLVLVRQPLSSRRVASVLDVPGSSVRLLSSGR